MFFLLVFVLHNIKIILHSIIMVRSKLPVSSESDWFTMSGFLIE